MLERGTNFLFNQLGLQYVWFPFSTKRILKFAKEFQPDIISLQNIHSGYFKTSLIAELSKIAPVVWTLHDMWAFTANAAYTFGDESWKHMRSGKQERKQFPTIGLNTGNWLLKRKKKIYSKSNLSVVCPSQWLQQLAQQSPAFQGKEILHIPNGIDTKRFCPPLDKNKCKQELGISPEQQVLLLSAEKLTQSERKGGTELLEILKSLDRETTSPVTLLTLGHGTLPVTFQHLRIKAMGYISELKQIIQALQASDLFLFPSKADNLPNTLVEAIACGVPCITYDVGGCREIVKNELSGLIVPAGQPELFLHAILRLLDHPDMLASMRITARKQAVENFDVQLMAERYFALFKALSSPK